jgi:hypothetical protein
MSELPSDGCTHSKDDAITIYVDGSAHHIQPGPISGLEIRQLAHRRGRFRLVLQDFPNDKIVKDSDLLIPSNKSAFFTTSLRRIDLGALQPISIIALFTSMIAVTYSFLSSRETNVADAVRYSYLNILRFRKIGDWRTSPYSRVYVT